MDKMVVSGLVGPVWLEEMRRFSRNAAFCSCQQLSTKEWDRNLSTDLGCRSKALGSHMRAGSGIVDYALPSYVSPHTPWCCHSRILL